MNLPPVWRRHWRGALLATLLAARPAGAAAQGYRVTVDSRVQRASYTGLTRDSIAATSVVTAADGALATPDGFAVRCVGLAYCSFFRPGPVLNGGPFVTSADAVVWGLGVPGLSIRASARLGLDVGNADVWPGTSPAVQLVEGYAEYAAPRITAQLGRTTQISRLGYTGLDGASVVLRGMGGAVSGGLYGGLGLARGVALPVTSPALTPLDDFQPRDRQQVLGANLAWTLPALSGRLVYERQISGGSHDPIAERVGGDAVVRVMPAVALSGGADYDLAGGQWGTAEVHLDVAPSGGIVTASVGARRYRPYFDLWTIWGAFNPVAYSAVSGALQVTAVQGVTLRASGEAYQYDPTETATPLTDVEDHGWRWAAGASYTPGPRWSADLGYRMEVGPGASARGVQCQARWRPRQDLALRAELATLDRPLEFRFDESSVMDALVNADWTVTDRLRLSAGVARYTETRDRPDAAAFDWNQWRLNAGVRWSFGSGGADRMGLPPAVLAIPEREARR